MEVASGREVASERDLTPALEVVVPERNLLPGLEAVSEQE